MDKKLFFIITLFSSFLFLHSSFVFGQNQHQIDSVKAIINIETNKEDLVDNFNNLSGFFCEINVDSAYFYANKALVIATENGYRNGEAEAYYLLSYLKDRAGKYTEAINILEKAIKIYTELNDSSYLVGCYNNLGVLYSYGTDQKTSLEYFIKAMNLAEEIKETFALSEAYCNVGSFYEYLKEYGLALKYYNKALDIDLLNDNAGNTGLTYLSIGKINLKLQRLDDAQENLKKAKKFISAVNDHYRQIELFTEFAGYFVETNQLDSAQNYINLADEKNKEFKYEKLDARISSLKGDVLLKQKQFKMCLDYYDRAISMYQNQNTHDGLYDIYLGKASALYGLGKHEEAYEMLLLAQKENEEFNPNELAKTIGEFEHSEATKEEYAKNRLEQEVLIQKNRNELILIRAKLHGAVISIVFLLILIALVIYFYFEKRKNNSLLEQNYKTIQEQKALLEENFIELKDKEKKLSQLNATKDKFFSIIAHDLKNPFNILMGLSDIVITDPEVRHSEEFEEIIDGIFQTAKSGYNLLENLLEWARSQTGELEYKPVLLNMNEIIAQNISLFEETAKAKKIKISSLNITDEKLFADYNMLNFVVRNLISNAIKFSFQNNKIEIRQKQKDDFYIFTIQDFGIGMNKESQDELFKIESTNPKAGTGNELGTGLGLIICKEFIGKNGGEIWVESQENKGSSFHFSLPGNNRKEIHQ